MWSSKLFIHVGIQIAGLITYRVIYPGFTRDPISIVREPTSCQNTLWSISGLIHHGRAYSWKPNIDRKLDSLSPIHKLIGRAMSWTLLDETNLCIGRNLRIQFSHYSAIRIWLLLLEKFLSTGYQGYHAPLWRLYNIYFQVVLNI